MTKTELFDALSEICTTYYNFAPVGAELPYMVYTWQHNDNFGADGKVYQKVASVEISLYSDDPGTAESVEDALDDLGVFWQAADNYEVSDKVYLTVFNFEEVEEE